MKIRRKSIFIFMCCTAVLLYGCERQKDENGKALGAAENRTEGIVTVGDTEERTPKHIITEDDIENISEIDYYITDKKNVISDKEAIREIAVEIANLQLEEVIPEEKWLEGGMLVDIAMKNGDVISMGCGDTYIGYGTQYYVENQLYSLIVEKSGGDSD